MSRCGPIVRHRVLWKQVQRSDTAAQCRYIQIMSAIFTFTSKYGGHSDVYNTIVTISRERSFRGLRTTSPIGLLRLVYVSARSGLPLPIS